ncbi:MAG: serine--tRNA ligase [Chloroflexi bacterium RBG_16_56_11]|nr:MAG: serine--tRNA ligase [Chloroflexi bacterium RBG_16_56_11]
MLDIRFVRENPEMVREAVANRNDNAPIDEILRLDSERRQKIGRLDSLRQERKTVSREREKAQERGRQLRTEIQEMEEEVRRLDAQLEALLLQMPNIPQSTVPVGKDESHNVVVRTWKEPKKFDFTPAPHWKLGEDLGIIDFDRGVKISGSRFYILGGAGARLQRSLIYFMLDMHTREHGYQEIYPPFMVKQECMVGSGQLPKFADNIYHDVEDDLWFVGTAEIPLTNLHRDEILNKEDLPRYYVAYTACFRREKMSAGKDTRGIKRGHQFDKVELYKFTEPEKSNEELEKLTRDAEEVCQKLDLPYRVVEHCTADMGFAAARSYDIEVWAPGIAEWLEVSSCSNCTDFQARRANVRYRPGPEARPQYVHTLNGSGLALPRIMIAVMENYQQPDGSITVPGALRDYMRTKVIKPDG